MDLDAPPLIESLMPEEAFYKALGEKPHHLIAVAIPSENRVIINRSQFFAVDGSERHATLVHEFTHLILGRRVPGGVPSWLDEGLAMVASDERRFGQGSRLVFAASFGGLIPLDRLFATGRQSIDAQELAYAEALSATRYLLSGAFSGAKADPDDPAPLARKLADPAEGEKLRILLRDTNFIAAFEARWRDSITTFWNWLGAIAGGGYFWAALTLLFLLAYWRKRRMSRKKELEWAAEKSGKGAAPNDFDDGCKEDKRDADFDYDDD
ncbi:hypothetical protein HYR69_09890 [Candidatus Sumerlaeota bacterium]|nr:hypothetical protein [Candidatus Sumerlaeota bacterium]